MKLRTLMLSLLALAALQGCSVNVIVAPHASLGIDSNNARVRSQTANQFNEVVEIVPVTGDVLE